MWRSPFPLSEEGNRQEAVGNSRNLELPRLG